LANWSDPVFGSQLVSFGRNFAPGLLAILSLVPAPARLLAQAGARVPAASATPSAARPSRAANSLSSSERSLLRLIRQEGLREVTSTLASPNMEGRGTATPGGERAARFIADRFASIGLKPLGDRQTFLQAVPFRVYDVLPESRMDVGRTSLRYGRDFVVTPDWSGNAATVRGPVVFVGFGVADSALKHDDLQGVDVLDKIVVVFRGRPDIMDDREWAYSAAERRVIEGLSGRGAAAIVFALYESAEQPYGELRRYYTFRNVARANDPPDDGSPPVLILSDSASRVLFKGFGLSLDAEAARARQGAFVSRRVADNATIMLRTKVEQVKGSNVVGLLEGSDPKLKDEAVVFSAHYDAYGMKDGEIYAGAADNALGTGMLFSVAEAMSRASPRSKRSVIFIATTGEEYGLLGAFHWTENPTWPIDRLVANVNFDGIGTETYAPVGRIVGFGSEYSDLGDVLAGAVRATGFTLTADPFPEQQPFYRSDQVAFAQKGIPSIVLAGLPSGDIGPYTARARLWLAAYYHQPADTVRTDWDWRGPTSLASVALLVGSRVANNPTPPKWRSAAPFPRRR
jgi:Zn-dependent M28 family amino/carboxypeptidase